jgi:hypothetical protein
MQASVRTGQAMTYGEVAMANIEGLQQTLEYIQEHPSDWDQMRWVSCFAGISLRVLKGAQLSELDCCNLCRDLRIDGRRLAPQEIQEAAGAALELTDAQRRALFHQTNDLAALTAFVQEFTAEKVPA